VPIAGLAPESVEDQSPNTLPSPNTTTTQCASAQAQPSSQEEAQLARNKLVQRQKHKFSKTSHVRLQAASQPLSASKDSAEYSLDSSEFSRIQQLSGKDFDFDGFCDTEGRNSHCKDFASKTCSFVDMDVSGKHVWMFPPPDQVLIKDSIDHLVHCWQKSPDTTSACIMLPKGFSHLTSGTEGRLRLIHSYAKGAKIWVPTSVDSVVQKHVKTTCAIQVYMLDRMSPHVLLNSIQTITIAPQSIHIDLLQNIDPEPLAFRFTASCKAISKKRLDEQLMFYADVLQDTGASVEFISMELALRKGLKLKPTHNNWTVTVANQETVKVLGSVNLQINIQGYTDEVKFLVIPMAYDMILGNRWARSRQAIVDYGKTQTTVIHKGNTFVLKPYVIHPSKEHTLEYPQSRKKDTDDSKTETSGTPEYVLNFAKATKAIRRGADYHAIEIQKVPDPPPKPPDPKDTPDIPIPMEKSGCPDYAHLHKHKSPKKKSRSRTTRNPPTLDEQVQDVRDAIEHLKSTAPSDTTNKITQDPEYAEKARWLSEEIALKTTALGEQVFRTTLEGLRDTGEPVEAIPTIPGARPPTRGLGRYSKIERDELQKHIDELLKQGLIEPSLSPYAAAALVVPKYKPDGSVKGWRLVIDYRMLNAITIKYQFPMPRIDDVMDSLDGAMFYSSCDATHGFWQLMLHPNDVPKTAFRTPAGLYQWRVLPMGLSNSPAVFQRTMASFFQKEVTLSNGTRVVALGTFIQIYMDDLLIYSKTAEEHLEHLGIVFEILKANQIYLNPNKCEFNKPEVRFLGHLVSKEGVRPDPDKVKVMKEWPAPTDKHELYRFLGFANYFRLFIRSYATIAAPLYPLTQTANKVDFAEQWTSMQQDCFEALKLALCTAPTLKLPDFDQPFEVVVDASNIAIGAVLLQDKRPVAYESKKLSPTEVRWTTTERELYAAVHALKQWRCYLQHPTHQFTLWTDHNPNIFFSDGNTSLTARQARWQEFLGPFHFQWRYKKGPENIADALSRLPYLTPTEENTEQAIFTINLNCMVLHATSLVPMPTALSTATPSATTTPKKKVTLPKKEPKTTPNRPSQASRSQPNRKRSPPPRSTEQEPQKKPKPTKLPPNLTPFEKQLWQLKDHPCFLQAQDQAWCQDDIGFWRTSEGQLVIPTTDLRRLTMEACHDSVFSGHFGPTRTINLAKRLFFWPDMVQDIRKYCEACNVCQRTKSSNQKPFGQLRPLPVPKGKWSNISVDMITGLPMTARGYNAIIVFVDRLTKMVHICPTTEKITSRGFAEMFLANIIRLHGCPESVVSDRGSIFTSKFEKEFLSGISCKPHFSSAYHPQSDGQTERANQVLEQVLRSYVALDHSEWDTFLPMAEFAMNNAPNEATGQTPFVLNYGISPRHPEVTKLTKTHLNGLELHSVKAKQTKAKADSAMQHCFREIKSDVPAAFQFTEAMKQAITHTKVMLEAARSRMIAITDQKRKETVPFTIGDKVMLSTKNIRLVHPGCNKLLPRWAGPFTITAKINPVAFKLDLPETMNIHDVFHTSLLKPYKLDPLRTDGELPPLIIDGEAEFEVEALLGRRSKTISTKKAKHAPGGKKRTTRWEYLVGWTGYGPEHNEYVPEQELLRHCKQMVKDYDKQHPRPKT
jgi:hypothetical protein